MTMLHRIKEYLLSNSYITSVSTPDLFPVLHEIGIDMRVYSKQGEADYRISWSSYPAEKMFFRCLDRANDGDYVFSSQAHYLFHQFSCGTIMVFHQAQLRDYLKQHWDDFPLVHSEKSRCSGVLVSVGALEKHVETYSELPRKGYKLTSRVNNVALLPPVEARN